MSKHFKPNTLYVDGVKFAVVPAKVGNQSAKCKLEPDYDQHCGSCGQSPTVGNSEMCGACFFGEADCIDPNNW